MTPSVRESDQVTRELLLLCYLVSDRRIFDACAHILKPEYFEKELQNCIRMLLDHTKTYSDLPNLMQIESTSDVQLVIMEDCTEPAKVNWVLDEVERHCRSRSLELALLRGISSIVDGDGADIPEIVREAASVSLHTDLGIDAFGDPLENLRRMCLKPGVATGFAGLDRVLDGGVGRGTLNIFAAPAGRGKSLMLVNLALNHAEAGDHVLYVSLELSQDEVLRRLYAMVSGTAARDVLRDMHPVSDRVQELRKSMQKVQVKFMPSGSKPRALDSFVGEYQHKTKRRVDVLVVDYLDLMSPNAKVDDLGNLWVKEKYVSEELRGIAAERDVVVYTASQLGRHATDAETFSQADIAGGISKVNTCDLLIGMRQTMVMKENGELELQVLKTRTSGGLYKRVKLLVDQNTYRMGDAPDEPAPPKPRTKGINMERLEKIKSSTRRM